MLKLVGRLRAGEWISMKPAGNEGGIAVGSLRQDLLR